MAEESQNTRLLQKRHFAVLQQFQNEVKFQRQSSFFVIEIFLNFQKG